MLQLWKFFSPPESTCSLVGHITPYKFSWIWTPPFFLPFTCWTIRCLHFEDFFSQAKRQEDVYFGQNALCEFQGTDRFEITVGDMAQVEWWAARAKKPRGARAAWGWWWLDVRNPGDGVLICFNHPFHREIVGILWNSAVPTQHHLADVISFLGVSLSPPSKDRFDFEMD